MKKSTLKNAVNQGIIDGHNFLTHYSKNDYAAIETATDKQLNYLAEQLTRMGFNLEFYEEPAEEETAAPEINESFTEFTDFDLSVTTKALAYWVFSQGKSLSKEQAHAADLMHRMMKLELKERNKKSP